MEFCSICTASFDTEDRRIRCSGQSCDLVFHQRCVHLTEIHMRAWLDDDVGLFWCCPTCRTDFSPVARKRTVGEEEEGEPSAAKRSRMDPSPRLPPEVWTMIFQHLDSRWLARVRLVCRDWNELVTTRSELMDRFLLKLGTAQFVDNLEELRHLLALGEGYTRAEINCKDIGKDRPRVAWFAALGQSLTTLTCRLINFGFLYELLRAFPNLKRLTLTDCFEYGKVVNPNYELNKLEELTIKEIKNKKYGESIFSTLKHICPRIKVLKFGEDCNKGYNELFNYIHSFVLAVAKTLQGIKITTPLFGLINELVTMNDLHLKRLTIDCSEEDLLRLIRRQPTLERLHFLGQLSNVTVFEEIFQILPNVKRIKLANVNLKQDPRSNQQINFPRAEFIRVRHVGSSDCVSGLACCLSSSLQSLELSGAYLSGDGLISLPQIATRIKSVSLSGCKVERLSALFAFIQQSQSLISFELNWLRVKMMCQTDMPDAANGHSGIRHLKYHDQSKDILHALFKLCPAVETLDIVHDLVKEDMVKMGQRWKRLRALKLDGYSGPGHRLSIECLRPIPTSFERLTKLHIKACVIPQEEVEDALQGLRKEVDFSIQYTVHVPPRRRMDLQYL
uniref:(northern house mosquito) hypothetical protein n=1 Tax=Culex pipiens TaxID=7175 RepID=A0A8D8G972_CULPI